MNSLNFILCTENLFMCAKQCFFEFKILPSVWPFIKFERWRVIGFFPHASSAGVFGINLNTLYPNFWSFKEVFSATNQTIRLFGLNTLT